MTRWQKILGAVALTATALGIILGPRSPYAVSWELMLGGFVIAAIFAGYASWRVAMEHTRVETHQAN